MYSSDFISTHSVAPYDCNEHFTIRAIKKLERAANIPVLTELESKLDKIRSYGGFEIVNHSDSSLVVQYLNSWLSAYMYKENKECITEPTWTNLLEALKQVKLDKLEKQIADCLKTAPEVRQPETSEGEVENVCTFL